jgi:hypothetical protein
MLAGPLAATKMKTIINITCGLLILASCIQNAESKTSVLIEIESPFQSSLDTTISIIGLSEQDFKIIKSSDTILYLRQLYEGIDGNIIEYDENSFQLIKARIKFEFSFLQYTIDDNPASPISFSKQSQWTELNCTDGKIEIPDFYGNTQNLRVHEQLNYVNFEELEKSFDQEFELIKRESIDRQTKFYNKLLRDRTMYETCCPEYINQANEFLEKQESDFNSLDKLGLELFYKTLIIEISGQLTNGKNFKKTIIEK